MRRLLALTMTVALMTSASVQAQESTTRGFNVGIHATGASISLEGSDERHGAGGGGLWIGYGFNRTVQLFVQLDGTEFDVDDSEVEGQWTMGHADLGVRFYFANSLRSWVPYLQTALTGRAVRVDDPVFAGTLIEDATMTGGGLTLGGGILFYFNQTFALDVQLDWTGGTFTELEYGNVTVSGFDLDARSARFNLGVSWWP